MQLFDLKGKTALVTGSTEGIGKAVALALAAAGAQVMVHGRSSETCEAVAAEVDAAGFVAADLSTPLGAGCVVRAVAGRFERLDILVNNAGVERHGGVAEFDLEDFTVTMQVNLGAPLELIHGLLPLLKASGRASVINVTSIHQDVPDPGNLNFSASKAALAMATQVMSLELAQYGVRVNNVAPGAVLTEINRALVEKSAGYFSAAIPLGRVAQTNEMAGSFVFLASDASKYMTGTTLTVDGGYSRSVVRN